MTLGVSCTISKNSIWDQSTEHWCIRSHSVAGPMLKELTSDGAISRLSQLTASHVDVNAQQGNLGQAANKVGVYATTIEEPCTREKSPGSSLGEMAVVEGLTTDIKNETLETLYGDDEEESLDDILIYDVINLYQSQEYLQVRNNGTLDRVTVRVSETNEDEMVEQIMLLSVLTNSTAA